MNFLLVLGTQKCGTSWLSTRLGRHPQYFSPLKEWRALSVLNKAFLKKTRGFDELELPLSTKKINKADFMALSMEDRREFLAVDFHNYFSVAVSAFGWRKSKSPDIELKAVGDITGANGLADENFLRLYKIAAESVGLRIKPVYLMRDPVSRHFSAVKMVFGNRVLGREVVLGGEFSVGKHSEALNKFCLESLGVDKFDKRASYQNIVPKIERVFGREEVLFAFSEHMKERDSIIKFTDFLGLDPLEIGETSGGSNVGLLKYEFPDDVKSKVYQHYSNVYSFVRDRFGAKVPQDWMSVAN